MSDQNTEPQAPETNTAPETNAETVNEGLTLEDAKKHMRTWQTRSEEWKSKAEANEKAAEELAEIKKSQMSELEKANAQIQELNQKMNDTLKEALVVKYNLDPESAQVLLNAPDEAGLKAQAEALAKQASQDRHPSVGNSVQGLSDRTVEPTNSKENAWKHVFGM